jgi:energy-converting hydrogenase Eha subunit C
MGAPYGRILIMHFTVLLGGFGAALFGQPLAMLILLVLLKLGADIALHLREHDKLDSEPSPVAASSGPG